ncbi:MAG TPA: hypothetical protein PLJ89_10985 [Thermoleophilia bacterium]|nr:hypothetical protein [Thermoleophilia bacterium]
MTPRDEELLATAREDAARTPAGALKRRVIPNPPEMDPAKRRQALGFLVVFALAACGVMAAVGVLNTVADPYGLVGSRLLPTITDTDRTIKADAIETLREAPQLVILGSSRAKRYEPAYLARKTGLRTFNASVSGIGGTADSWAMANFIHDTFPRSRPAYFWLVDVESFVPFAVQGRTAAEPRLAQYVRQGGHGRRTVVALLRNAWNSRASVESWTTARDSLRVLLEKDRIQRAVTKTRKKYLPDGGLTPRVWSRQHYASAYPSTVRKYTEIYRDVYKQLDSEAKRYFVRTLAFMNANGAKPVVVLTPINPKLLKVVAPLGWTGMHRQVVDYIESLHGRYDFVFVDITDSSTFGADPGQFDDGVHMTTVNTRRAVNYVLRRTGGIPR